ncbi:hypothetical protein IAE39_001636 [Pseudomonas sp. S37]|uniref:hypothetical protein n=1 Tax=Pseudomonas sp. S37 TaxID=2767449 RepID=UPI001914ACC7|nr:hypothetical protein [Pseudomonas sp. S37]MBK4993462.1 hypothetical protein [Pseudomonas sp. S37]
MHDDSLDEPLESHDPEQQDNQQPEKTLSRRKRGVGPVSGMSCAPGYKMIGDDCIVANIDFD